jgi:hypothetical protein
MGRIWAVVVKEVKEAMPAMIFFLLLFHMIGLTKAVVLDEFSFTALRAAAATMGALIAAKGILLVDILPIARLFQGRLIIQILWKSLLYGMMVLLLRFLEELIPLIPKHGGLASALKAMQTEVDWPLFAVMELWILGGLFLYCLASELAKEFGPDKVKAALFGSDESRPKSADPG